jgi:hypothetical protein
MFNTRRRQPILFKQISVLRDGQPHQKNNRVILSCALVLVPFSRIVPNLSTWVVRDRMRDLYRRLRLVEAEMQTDLTTSQLDALQSDLERIEQSANNLGMPIRHSDLFLNSRPTLISYASVLSCVVR